LTLDNDSDVDSHGDDIAIKMKDLAIGERKKHFKSQLDSLKFDSSFSGTSSCGSKGESKDEKKTTKATLTIELLESSSSEDEEENASIVLLSDSSSHSVFRMKTPSPSNSVLSIRTPKETNVHNTTESFSSPGSDSNFSSNDDDDDDLVGSAWKKNKYGCYELKGKCLDAGNVNWPKLNIPKQLYDKLYDHQKIGVQFLASLHAKGIGGILGDDMGLGKTFQTCSLLAGLMKSRSIRNALIICPVAVMKNWERESRLIIEHLCGLSKVTIRVVDSSIRRERRSMFLEEALTW
jgi:Superfamily II DNA/RNA helicases, SNF2 family